MGFEEPLEFIPGFKTEQPPQFGLADVSALESSTARASRARRDRSPPDAPMRPARSSGIWTVSSMLFHTNRFPEPGQSDSPTLQLVRLTAAAASPFARSAPIGARRPGSRSRSGWLASPTKVPLPTPRPGLPRRANAMDRQMAPERALLSTHLPLGFSRAPRLRSPPLRIVFT